LQFRLSPEQRSRYRAVSLQLRVSVGAKGVQYRLWSGSQEHSGTFLGTVLPRVETFEVRVLVQDPPDGIERIIMITQDAVQPVDSGKEGEARPCKNVRWGNR
jgi:hypothetical protein